MPWKNQEGDGRKAGGLEQQPDLEELLKAKQPKRKQMTPSGAGRPSAAAFVAAIIVAAAVGYSAFTFRVYPDELGVVVRSGKSHAPGAGRS